MTFVSASVSMGLFTLAATDLISQDRADCGGKRQRSSCQRLDAAEKELREKLAGIAGALIERKCFSIAAHYRKVNESDFPELERAVSEVAARHQELRTIEGKKVYELLPSIDWDKGKAVLWLLENLGLERPTCARFTLEMIAPTKMPFAHSRPARHRHSRERDRPARPPRTYSLESFRGGALPARTRRNDEARTGGRTSHSVRADP